AVFSLQQRASHRSNQDILRYLWDPATVPFTDPDLRDGLGSVRTDQGRKYQLRSQSPEIAAVAPRLIAENFGSWSSWEAGLLLDVLMHLPCLIFNINFPERKSSYENNKNNDNHHLYCSFSTQFVFFSRTKENFLITASQDRTMKVWLLPKFPTISEKENQIVVLQARQTEVAHDKDVNSVAVSPNDKLVATGSQDKTAKLWNCENCALLGVFSGHKRGIWCVQFSPVDQVLATSSADGTVKIWDLQDFSCLKTFEGHDASVLKVIFVSEGGQVLSSGADGLLKLWTIKNNECVKTLDAHDNKVWALHANKKDDTVVTGSTDSKVLLWKDVTQTELEEEQAKQEEQILKDQELANLLHKKQFLKALGLALSLDRPHTVLTVIKAILKEPRGKEDLARNLMKLRKDQKEAVLKFSITWNTNTRNCLEAQAVVEILLKHENPEDLLKYEGIKTAVESLLPYTERHFQRLGRLLQASVFLDFMWQNMRLAEFSTSVSFKK
uniref:U3 small nucleolar RNA-associated protein 13 C-terminal domain-containing protein n=1 Tax=Laticauda laticaudata TaxID=8630 RepID=A0A8C5RGZ6_LATLA